MDERLPYVTKRTNADGATRWYWQRPGHKLVRLPADRVERFKAATGLNEAAARDARLVAEPRGSIAWVVAKYRADEVYTGLAEGTRRYYDPIIEDILALGGRRPFAELDRTAVIDYVESWPEWHNRRKVAAVLRNLFQIATYYRVAAANHAAGLRLAQGTPRDAVWDDGDAEAWLRAARRHPHGDAMALAFQLLRFTAQRPVDCLRMPRGRYTGGTIQLRQQKTGKLVWVPCHRELRAALDAPPRGRAGAYLAGRGADPMPYSSFIVWFSRIKKDAGLDGRDLQPRDLRRTAAVRLAEAGCTVPEIAAITGHTIEQTQKILEAYLPRTYEMAKNAMAKWERKGRGEGTGV